MNTCECCGAKVVEYKHSMTRALINTLIVFYEEVGDSWGKGDMLSHNERCNFPKLRYWRLIEKKEGTSEWRIRDLGKDFLAGHLHIPKKAITYRGEVVRREGDMVFLKDLKGKFQRRADYAREAVAHVG